MLADNQAMIYLRELLLGPVGYLFIAIFGVGTLGGVAAFAEIAVRLSGG